MKSPGHSHMMLARRRVRLYSLPIFFMFVDPRRRAVRQHQGAAALADRELAFDRLKDFRPIATLSFPKIPSGLGVASSSRIIA
jgi:hypothetical protein